jgi:hypothetical protein
MARQCRIGVCKADNSFVSGLESGTTGVGLPFTTVHVNGSKHKYMTALHIYSARDIHVLEFFLILSIDGFQICAGGFLFNREGHEI